MVKRVKPGDLNEELIIQSFKHTGPELKPADVVGTAPEVSAESQPGVKEPESERETATTSGDDTGTARGKSRRRKGNYDEIYLRRKEIKSRQPVYISQEIHQSITRLVHLLALANKEISVGGYIDNVLSEHLERHRDEIADLYRQQMNEFL